MDFFALAVTCIATTALFLVLELVVILPLIRRIVTQVLDRDIIPSLNDYVLDMKNNLGSDLKTIITEQIPSIADKTMSRITGRLGGRQKGVNAIMSRIADGETLDDIQDDYNQATVEQAVELIGRIADAYATRAKKSTTTPGGW